jgi:hypothetical protein
MEMLLNDDEIKQILNHYENRDNSISHGTDDRDLIPGKGWEFVSPPRPDQLWGPPNLLFNGYRRHFTGG